MLGYQWVYPDLILVTPEGWSIVIVFFLHTEDACQCEYVALSNMWLEMISGLVRAFSPLLLGLSNYFYEVYGNIWETYLHPSINECSLLDLPFTLQPSSFNLVPVFPHLLFAGHLCSVNQGHMGAKSRPSSLNTRMVQRWKGSWPCLVMAGAVRTRQADRQISGSLDSQNSEPSEWHGNSVLDTWVVGGFGQTWNRGLTMVLKYTTNNSPHFLVSCFHSCVHAACCLSFVSCGGWWWSVLAVAALMRQVGLGDSVWEKWVVLGLGSSTYHGVPKYTTTNDKCIRHLVATLLTAMWHLVSGLKRWLLGGGEPHLHSSLSSSSICACLP